MHNLSLTISALVSALALQGCAGVGVAIQGVEVAAASVSRNQWELPAANGDAEAQYRLGKSYCCTGIGFDTQKATEWLCLSARQNHADAQYELARIYSGDVVRSFAPGKLIVGSVRAKESPADAALWMDVAAANGHEDAQKEAEKFQRSLTLEQRATVEQRSVHWRDANCEYDTVFPPIESQKG